MSQVFIIKIHQISVSLGHDWSKRVQLKLGNIRVLFPNFQNSARCEKNLKDNMIMSKDIYPSTFLRQMEVNVYICPQFDHTML